MIPHNNRLACLEIRTTELNRTRALSRDGHRTDGRIHTASLQSGNQAIEGQRHPLDWMTGFLTDRLHQVNIETRDRAVLSIAILKRWERGIGSNPPWSA